MNQHRISLIIPCYRDAATLERAIKSVLIQTYPVDEIIVVNDCSPETDAIEAIVSAYPIVRYICNKNNIGLAATRNVGIGAASGDIVCFLDADDEYDPGKIEAQITAWEPGVAITCGLMYIHLDGRRTPGPHASEGQRVLNNPNQILYRNMLNGAGLLIERELLMAHGAFDDALRSCEDFDLWLRILSAGVKVKDVGQPLYLYHFNPKGLSKNYHNISKWEIEVLLRHARRMGEDWMHSRQYASLMTFWILRQIYRYELKCYDALRSQIMSNIDLLSEFRVRALWLRTLLRTRAMYFPAKLLQLMGRQ